MAEVDLKAAFRMVPVRPEDWELLGIKWDSEYYIDTCLPFGLRSAPFLFNQVAEAVQWILQHNYGLERLIHYPDDYLLIRPPATPLCGKQLTTFLEVCQHLGVPVAHDKVEGPSTTMTFLGLEIDTIHQQLRLPLDKLAELKSELNQWAERKKTTKRELLSIIGKLSFAAKAVPAGRLFLRRLISLSTSAKKLHHYIHLNTEARADISWWQEFLPMWNGKSYFIESSPTNASNLELYTDASGTHGCGAYYRGEWFHHDWQPHQQLSPQISIQWQELFAIVAATLTWGPHWHRKKVRFNCDNMAIVLAWQGQSSKQPRIVNLFRRLFFSAAEHNFTLTLVHLLGIKNGIADSISRKQYQRFFTLAPQAKLHPTATPGLLTEL